MRNSQRYILPLILVMLMTMTACHSPAPRAEQAWQKMALVVAGSDVRDIEIDEGVMRYKLNGAADLSSATPIAPDGYFLTTYHSVTEGEEELELRSPITLILRRPYGVQSTHVEVVWYDQERDLALLWAPTFISQYYELIDHPAMDEGTKVYSGGYRTAGRESKLIQVKDNEHLVHGIGLEPGDSGGALFNEHGELLGIHTVRIQEWGYPFFGSAYGESQLIPHDDLHQVMNRHRTFNIERLLEHVISRSKGKASKQMALSPLPPTYPSKTMTFILKPIPGNPDVAEVQPHDQLLEKNAVDLSDTSITIPHQP